MDFSIGDVAAQRVFDAWLVNPQPFRVVYADLHRGRFNKPQRSYIFRRFQALKATYEEEWAQLKEAWLVDFCQNLADFYSPDVIGDPDGYF